MKKASGGVYMPEMTPWQISNIALFILFNFSVYQHVCVLTQLEVNVRYASHLSLLDGNEI